MLAHARVHGPSMNPGSCAAPWPRRSRAIPAQQRSEHIMANVTTSLDSCLLVRDQQGTYRPASADEVLRAARRFLSQRVRRGCAFTYGRVQSTSFTLTAVLSLAAVYHGLRGRWRGLFARGPSAGPALSLELSLESAARVRWCLFGRNRSTESARVAWELASFLGLFRGRPRVFRRLGVRGLFRSWGFSVPRPSPGAWRAAR